MPPVPFAPPEVPQEVDVPPAHPWPSRPFRSWSSRNRSAHSRRQLVLDRTAPGRKHLGSRHRPSRETPAAEPLSPRGLRGCGRSYRHKHAHPPSAVVSDGSADKSWRPHGSGSAEAEFSPRATEVAPPAGIHTRAESRVVLQTRGIFPLLEIIMGKEPLETYRARFPSNTAQNHTLH